MLTREENDLLCRVEGDAPMGQLMRRHWTPVCLVEEVSRADGAPVQARVFGENLVVFRDSDGRVGVLDEPARTAGPRWCSAATRTAACAACTTAGRWTCDGNVLEMASEPAASGMVDKVATRPTRCRSGAAWCGPGSGPADDAAEVPAARLGPDCRYPRQHRQGAAALQLGPDPGGRDRLGAQLQPAFVRHGAGPRGWRQGHRQDLAAPLHRQGAAHAGAAHRRTGSATRRCAARSRTPPRTSTCARPCSWPRPPR
jgi:hypothetical protein